MKEVSQATFPRVRLWLTLILCGVECLFFGATITGWASIVYVFKDDGVFSHLCEEQLTGEGLYGLNQSYQVTTVKPLVSRISSSNESTLYEHEDIIFPRCSAQDKMFSLIFTVDLLTWGIVGIFIGWFFDKFGLLKTRIIAIICGSTGFLTIAWAGSNMYTSYLLFPGTLLIVICSATIMITNPHMASLAGVHAPIAVAIFCGAANSSIVIFLIIKILHDEDIPRNITLSVVASIWILVLLYSLFIMPSFKVVTNNSSNSANSYEFVNETYTLSDTNDGIISVSGKFNNTFPLSGESANELRTSSYKNSEFNKSNDSMDESSYEKTGFDRAYNSKDEINASSGHNIFNDSIEENNSTPHVNSQLRESNDLVDGMKSSLHLNSEQKEENNLTEEKIPTLMACLKSLPFIFHSIWFSLIYLTYFTCIGTYNPWITEMFNNNDNTVNHLTNVLAYCQLSSILISFLPGAIVDLATSKLKVAEKFHQTTVPMKARWEVGTAVAISFRTLAKDGACGTLYDLHLCQFVPPFCLSVCEPHLQT